jgi:hypothetical protein
MHEKTASIFSLIDMYTHSRNKLASDFEEYVANKSIPLIERWEMFCKAPDELKNSDSSIVTFQCEEKFHEIDYTGSDSPFSMLATRNEEIATERLVDLLIGNEDEIDAAGYGWTAKQFAQALMEDILQSNLGSFTFDW